MNPCSFRGFLYLFNKWVKKFNVNFKTIVYGVNPIYGARIYIDVDEEDIKEITDFLKGAYVASEMYKRKVVNAS